MNDQPDPRINHALRAAVVRLRLFEWHVADMLPAAETAELTASIDALVAALQQYEAL